MTNRVEVLNRRQFLVRLGAASASITVVGTGLSAFLNSRVAEAEAAALAEAQALAAAEATPQAVAQGIAEGEHPNANDPVVPAPGTRPEYTPLEDHYRIDIAATPPRIDGTTWRLPITGLVDSPLELTLDDLRNNFNPVSQYITMACISNRIGGELIGTTLWTGASFRDVLAQAQPQSNATHVRITGGDGFDETVSLEEVYGDPNIVLCYAWDNQPLPERNGFPLRIHIPNRFGMKQPKWITGMELIEGDQDGYWVRRGWSKDAFIRATSVIDTVAVDQTITNDAGATLVPIGGIAWAGPRRVSKVELRVDDGPWVEAELRAPLNNSAFEYKTWRIWRYDWPFVEGQHTFAVRMVEGDGTPQIEQEEGVRPDGATGLHTASARLNAR